MILTVYQRLAGHLGYIRMIFYQGIKSHDCYLTLYGLRLFVEFKGRNLIEFLV